MNTSDLLQRIFFYENTDGVTVEEVAQATHMHIRSVYFYIEGGRHVSTDWLAAASRYLVESYGDTRIAEVFLPDSCSITCADTVPLDGVITDEILSTTSAMGRVVDSFAAGDCGECELAADEIARQAARIKAEAKRKRSNKNRPEAEKTPRRKPTTVAGIYGKVPPKARRK